MNLKVCWSYGWSFVWILYKRGARTLPCGRLFLCNRIRLFFMLNSTKNLPFFNKMPRNLVSGGSFVISRTFWGVGDGLPYRMQQLSQQNRHRWSFFLETILNVLSDIQELLSCWLAGAESSLVFDEVFFDKGGRGGLIKAAPLPWKYGLGEILVDSSLRVKGPFQVLTGQPLSTSTIFLVLWLWLGKCWIAVATSLKLWCQNALVLQSWCCPIQLLFHSSSI